MKDIEQRKIGSSVKCYRVEIEKSSYTCMAWLSQIRWSYKEGYTTKYNAEKANK